MEGQQEAKDKQRFGPYGRHASSAAKKLQGLFRSRKARKNIQLLLQTIFERIYDPDSGSYYYYNSKTGESSWEAPRLLAGGTRIMSTAERERVMEKKAKGTYKTAANMSRTDAARVIQGCVRSWKARKLILQLVSALYEEVIDEESGAVYYYNTRTGESSWSKPRLMANHRSDADNRDGGIKEKVKQVDRSSKLEAKEEVSNDLALVNPTVAAAYLYKVKGLSDFLKDNGLGRYEKSLIDEVQI